MSISVKERLESMGIYITHEDRLNVDKDIEKKTGIYCDKGVDLLSDDEIRKIVDKVEGKQRVVVYV